MPVCALQQTFLRTTLTWTHSSPRTRAGGSTTSRCRCGTIIGVGVVWGRCKCEVALYAACEECNAACVFGGCVLLGPAASLFSSLTGDGSVYCLDVQAIQDEKKAAAERAIDAPPGSKAAADRRFENHGRGGLDGIIEELAPQGARTEAAREGAATAAAGKCYGFGLAYTSLFHKHLLTCNLIQQPQRGKAGFRVWKSAGIGLCKSGFRLRHSVLNSQHAASTI